MRKILLLAFGLFPFVAFSQATILSDDFESYTAGNLLAANSALWTTWSGGIDDEDAYVSSDQSNSGSNSVHVIGSSGPTDLILPFPSDYSSGVYEFSLKMYIVSGNGGYFNIQQSSTPGLGWMFEIYFDDAGGGYISAGGANAASVSYTPNAWISVNVWVDLTNDLASCYINSTWIHSWQWSLGADGLGADKTMGGVDVFAYAANGANGDFYVDNVLLQEKTTTGIIVDDFERYVGGELLAANSDLWTTWSGGVDAEDAFVSLAHGSSGFNSVNIVGNNGPTDLILPFPSDYTSGVYEFSVKMNVSLDNGAYWNIQQSSVPGLGWMFEIYCDDAGGGYISAGAANAATFSYTPNTWMDVKVKADLTNDIGECYINSDLIHTWQWSLGATGTGTIAQLGGVDFYAYAANGDPANFYIDDVLLDVGFPTGITTESSGSDMLITPNPSNGQFSASASNLPAGEYQIQLVDVLGNLVSSETTNISGSVKKDFSVDLASGIYFVRFTSGNTVSTRKIIIR